MPWARLHDQANGSGKLLALSDTAWRLWGCSLIYCQANLTDGFVPDHAIETFGVRAKGAVFRRAVEELLSSLVPGKQPLWVRVTGGYQLHDYLDWNDSRETVLRERLRSKDRVDRFRQRLEASRNAVTNGGVTPLPTPNESRDERKLFTGSTTTKDQKPQEQRGSRRAPRPPEENQGALTVIAHDVLEDIAAGLVDFADASSELKTRAAKANLVYDSDRVRKALDSAEYTRSERRLN